MIFGKACSHVDSLFFRKHWTRVGYHYGTTGKEDLEALRPSPGNEDVELWHQAFAKRCQVPKAFSFASGRMALYALLRAIGLEPGDEVILPAYTCVVVPNAVFFAKGRPIYAEINPQTFNLDLEDVRRKITPRTKAILLQHTFGLPMEVEPFRGLRGIGGKIWLIEDCCHALGAELRGRPVGSFGDAAFYSCDATKMICTEIGGMAAANDPVLSHRLEETWRATPELPQRACELLRNQFKLKHYCTRPSIYWNFGRYGLSLWSRSPWAFRQSDERNCLKPTAYPYPARFPRSLIGVALSQLKSLDRNLAHRRHVAAQLQKIFSNYTQANVLENSAPSWLRFPLRVKNPEIWRQVFDKYIEVGDWFNSPTYGFHGHPERVGYSPGMLPISEEVHRHSINFPTHEMMNQNMLKFIKDLLDHHRLDLH